MFGLMHVEISLYRNGGGGARKFKDAQIYLKHISVFIYQGGKKEHE